ncbi:late competence development ComFB family protein [Marispirochaeta sp.]|jgi:competence protein ComFB|uniref:late competence development ComFB family protein n=1 Tax=Marispirochaeta sp. TaxID=2038653 RepID=UPI0029C9524A|nr:late competence development ComFB family protein [Marispirochaeta sp.]
MALEEIYDFSQIRNQAEKLVIEEIERQLPEEEHQSNEEFILDIATFALNHLRPIYSYTLLGKLYTDNLEENYYNDVEKAVSNAILKIRGNP